MMMGGHAGSNNGKRGRGMQAATMGGGRGGGGREWGQGGRGRKRGWDNPHHHHHPLVLVPIPYSYSPPNCSTQAWRAFSDGMPLPEHIDQKEMGLTMGEGKHSGNGFTIMAATVTVTFAIPVVTTATTTYNDIVTTVVTVTTISGDIHTRGTSTPALSVNASVPSSRHAILSSYLFRRDWCHLQTQIIRNGYIYTF
jgi:hypothetical protein